MKGKKTTTNWDVLLIRISEHQSLVRQSLEKDLVVSALHGAAFEDPLARVDPLEAALGLRGLLDQHLYTWNNKSHDTGPLGLYNDCRI